MKKLALLCLLLCGFTSAQVVTPPGVPEDFSGTTKVAVVLANFSDAPSNYAFDQDDIDALTEQMFGPGPNVSDLFHEMSFGVDSFTGDVLPVVTIDSTGYDGNTVCGEISNWREEAVAKVHQTSPGKLSIGNPDGYQLVAVFMSRSSDCDSTDTINGVAVRAASYPVGSTDLAAVVMTNWRTAQTTAHEFGHLKGWNHNELDGYTGQGKGYGDHTCTMGDNYIYSNHPEYAEYNPPPGGLPVLLDMRQANALNKIYSDYIKQSDLFDTPDAAGTYTAYLAPTQVEPSQFPTGPGGANVWHAAVVDITGVEYVYVVSYRSGFEQSTLTYDNVYDSDPMFDHLMGRVHVHRFHRGGGRAFRMANLEAGEDYDDGFIEITAVTDGLNDESYVEVEIEVFPLYPATVDIEPLLEEKTFATVSGAFPFTLTNTGPGGTGVSTFDLSIENADPLIVGATITPESFDLAPGESATGDIVLNFANPPADGSYSFELLVDDQTHPRPATTVQLAYVNDLIGPQIGGLNADHQGDKVILSWNEERDTDLYDIRKGGNFIALGHDSPMVEDGTVNPFQEPMYEVQGTDIFGNVGPWVPVTAIYPCKNQALIEIDSTELQSNALPASASETITITNNNPAGCPTFNYGISSPSGAPGQWNVVAGNLSVPANSSATTDVSVVFFPIPNPVTPEERFHFSLRASDPNGVGSNTIPQIYFTHDTLAPGSPSNLFSCTSNNGIDIQWSAGSDNVGIAGYRVDGASGELTTTSSLFYLDSTFDPGYDVRTVDYVDKLSPAASISPTPPSGSIASIITNQANPAFTVDVTNNNVVSCTSSTFDLSVATGNASVDATIALASGASGVANGTLNESAEGVYPFSVDVQGVVVNGSATIDLTDPTAPSALAVTNSGGASLSWTAATDALTSVASYDVLRNGAAIGSAAGTSFVDASPAATNPLSYEVRAVDAAGNQGPGDSWSVTIGGIAKDYSICDQTTVSWTTTAAVSCSMRYKLFNSSTWSSWYNTASGTAHSVTVPTSKNKKYDVEVDCLAETSFTMKTPKFCISM